jgi:hypothetical protein
MQSPGQRETEHASSRAYERALDHELPHQLACCRAERTANRDLSPSRDRARQLDICHVGSRREEQQTGSRQQDEQRRTNLPGDVVEGRHYRDFRLTVAAEDGHTDHAGFRRRVRPGRGLGGGLRRCCAWAQARHRAEQRDAPVV